MTNIRNKPIVIVVILIAFVLPGLTDKAMAWNGEPWGEMSRDEIVSRADQMIDSTWSPQNTIYNFGYGSTYHYFYAGTTYTGEAYSQCPIQDTWPEFYQEVTTTSGGTTYYGNDCSGFASISWRLPARYVTRCFEQDATTAGTFYCNVHGVWHEDCCYSLGPIGSCASAGLIIGDACVRSGDHIILYLESASGGRMRSMEQTPWTAQRKYWYWSSLDGAPYLDGYRPIRRRLLAVAVQPPTVETTNATNVTDSAATLNATIIDNGGASIDERRFDWGTTSSCSDGWTADVTVNGNSFSYRLSSLQPDTTYYFRGWAHNSAGWSHGDVLSFTTQVAPDTTPPTVSAFSVTPISLTLGNSFTVSYTVSDSGGSGLNRSELWRANDSGGSPVGWAEILPERTSLSGNGPVSGSFSDAPSSTGTYWYGMHVVDNAGNWNDEKNSNTGGLPGVYGPKKVTVTSPPCSVSTPATPSGPSSGQTGQSLSYSTGGSTCSNGHSVQYRFDWGDGSGYSSWGSATQSHTYTSANTYTVKAQARCASTLTESSWSSGKSVTISLPPCSVTTPTTPSGPSSGQTGQSLSYSTGGSSCSNGHSVQYRFDWGDGSGYSSWGSATQSHIYSSANTYTIKAQARCASTLTESSWSSGKSVTISLPSCSVTTPTTPSGPSSGQTGQNLSYSTGGSTCSNGHSVQYRFDWGDGSGYSSWGSATQSHTYSSANIYTVKAQARCASTFTESSWSSGISVTIIQEQILLSPMTVDLNNDGIPNFYDFSYFAMFWLDTSCSSPSWCEGRDFDHDGVVGINDLQIFAEFWLWPVADVDMDSAVNFTDYAIFANNWMDDTCCDPNWCEGTDFDHSGSVDMLDLVTFARYWLEGTSP